MARPRAEFCERAQPCLEGVDRGIFVTGRVPAIRVSGFELSKTASPTVTVELGLNSSGFLETVIGALTRRRVDDKLAGHLVGPGTSLVKSECRERLQVAHLIDHGAADQATLRANRRCRRPDGYPCGFVVRPR